MLSEISNNTCTHINLNAIYFKGNIIETMTILLACLIQRYNYQ